MQKDAQMLGLVAPNEIRAKGEQGWEEEGADGGSGWGMAHAK